MMIDSVILLIHLRIDKINTTPESFGETNKRRRLTPGEELHTDQRTLLLKEEPSQTDITSTTITSRPPSRIPTPLLRPPDNLPSTPKKLPMPGERDPPQTPDQSLL